MPTINAAIVGASGYAGMELARLLILHPNVRAEWFISRAAAGREVCDLIPALDGISDCRFTAPDDADFSNCDVVFFAAPSGVAMRAVPKLLEQGKVVIDIGADFRLRDINIFGEWYGEHTAPQLLQKAVYGLSEYARPQLKKANLIACPGCKSAIMRRHYIELSSSCGIISSARLLLTSLRNTKPLPQLVAVAS